MSETSESRETTGSLPAQLDNPCVIFSYGSLLDHANLRSLLKHRGEFRIRETGDAAEAASLAAENPGDIVILTNVRLENVRVSMVTERMLRRWFDARGGDLKKLIDAGVTTTEIPEAVFLYARPTRAGERGRSLNGGLICNLTTDDVAVLDKYEFEPALKRTPVSELKIQDITYRPELISFYAGTESVADITPEERAERSRFLDLNRLRGQRSPQAKWPAHVRQRTKADRSSRNTCF